MNGLLPGGGIDPQTLMMLRQMQARGVPAPANMAGGLPAGMPGALPQGPAIQPAPDSKPLSGITLPNVPPMMAPPQGDQNGGGLAGALMGGLRGGMGGMGVLDALVKSNQATANLYGTDAGSEQTAMLAGQDAGFIDPVAALKAGGGGAGMTETGIPTGLLQQILGMF